MSKEARTPSEDPISETETKPEPEARSQVVMGAGGRFTRFRRFFMRHKFVITPLVLVVVLAVLAAIPASRYALAGTFMKQDFKTVVTDQETRKPVSGAKVTIGDVVGHTDKDGKVSMRVGVGYNTLHVAKKYYKSTVKQVLVPIGDQKGDLKLSIKATGRQVPVTVNNRINKLPLANVTFKVLGTETKTDKDGKVTLVLPPEQSKVDATLQLDGYNAKKAQIQVTTKEVAANNFELTPSGKVYFLSKLSGKLDVVSANLDGTERKVLVAGTGNESEYYTHLTEANDDYLVLQSRRDGGEYDKLFRVDKETGEVVTIDEGEATFELRGTTDRYVIYTVDRANKPHYSANRVAIKSYNLETKRLVTLDQNELRDGLIQQFAGPYIVDGKLVYTVTWTGGNYYYQSAKSWPSAIRSVQFDGSQQKNVKVFDNDRYSNGYINVRKKDLGELYFQVDIKNSDGASYFAYKDDKVVDASITEDEFSKTEKMISRSPSRDKTAWSELRDGKRYVLVGDREGRNEKEVARLDGKYFFGGWHSDDYFLFQKDSKLFVMDADGLGNAKDPQEVTSIHSYEYQYGY
jgi:hypothetical protein